MPAGAVETGTDEGVGQATAAAPPPEASAAPATTPTPAPVAANPEAYNPLAAQPYSAPVANPVTPLPQPNLGPDPQANGAVTHAGAAAYGIDQVLRGFMRGRAQAQAINAIQLQKQSTGLQQNLDAASREYYALSQAGTDPNSQQMQDAKSRVDAAWQSNMDFMKQHVAGEQIDKKTGQLKPQSGSILSRLTQSQDPAAQSVAAYQAAQKLGPPVYHQTAAFQTPQYQAYARTQAQTAGITAQGQLATAQEGLEQQRLESRYNQLSSITGRELTPDEDQERSNLAIRLGKAGAGLALAKDQLAQGILANPNLSSEDKTKQLMLLSSRSAAGMFLKQPQLGTRGFLQAQYAKANGIDPSNLTPQDIAYLDKVEALARQNPTTTSHTQLVNGTDAQGHAAMIPMTTYSTRSVAGAPPPPQGRKSVDEIGAVPTEGAAGAATHPIVPPAAPPSAGVAAANVHANALSAGHSPTQAVSAARTAASAVNKSYYGGVNVGQPIPTGLPRKETAEESATYKLEDTGKESLDAAKQAAQDPDKQLGDKALVLAFARSHVGGRVSDFEVKNLNNLGTAQMRLVGSAYQVANGTLSPQQRQMMLTNMQHTYDAVHQRAEDYRQRRAGAGQNTGVGGGASATPVTPPMTPPTAGGFDPAKDFVPAAH